MTHGAETLRAVTCQVREFLDALAATGADDAQLQRLTAALTDWTAQLRPAVPEGDAWHEKRRDLPGRGRTFYPPVTVHQRSSRTLIGSTQFGRLYLGRNGAAHGGAIAALFDEMLGGFINPTEQVRARTAYLHVGYRAITPIETPLTVKAEITRAVGRKLFLTGSIISGDIVCAQADALFVKLRPGQP